MTPTPREWEAQAIICSECEGVGYFTEHYPGCDNTCQDQMCPVQAPCETCHASGKIMPLPMVVAIESRATLAALERAREGVARFHGTYDTFAEGYIEMTKATCACGKVYEREPDNFDCSCGRPMFVDMFHENLQCPFCSENEFDRIGLKNHLNIYCGEFRNTPNL